MATSGSVESISLKGRIFPVAADADTQRKLGGYENEVLANGDGSARMKKTRVPLMISGIKVQIDDTRSDQEFLQDIQDGADFVPFSITYVSGFTYMGQAQIVGEVQYSSQDGIAELSLSGPGKATQQ